MKANSKIIQSIIILCFIAIVLVIANLGIRVSDKKNATNLDLNFTKTIQADRNNCLVIINSNEDYLINNFNMTFKVLDDMRIPYDVWDVNIAPMAPSLDIYDSIVTVFSDWDSINKYHEDLKKWVYEGGHLLNTVSPYYNDDFSKLMNFFDIVYTDGTYTAGDKFWISHDFMLGLNEKNVFTLVQGEEAEGTSLKVQLKPNAEILAAYDDVDCPIIWKNSYGDGNYIFINQMIIDRYQRGILCSAYRELQDFTIYPVINGSAFYLDDFPSPVPAGYSEYITRDYDMDIRSFYEQKWFPDILSLMEKYDLNYTCLVIENYSKKTSPPFKKNGNSKRFEYFGNIMLNKGCEIGIHGYNHNPLCIAEEELGYLADAYEIWKTEDNIKDGLLEVIRFTENLYPSNSLQVYVPPSNIISKTGINVLKNYTDLKIIASVYLPEEGSTSYVQEFDVSNDGMINTPRITSGEIIDDYMFLSEICELNFHYVQSHFIHPDDVLDEERGANYSWDEMFKQLDHYFSWLKNEAPDLRNLNGSQMGKAVLKYDRLSINTRDTDDQIIVDIGGFSTNAYFIIKSESTIEGIIGASYKQISDDLYLINAAKNRIIIEKED